MQKSAVLPTPNEYAATSAAPVELTPPVPLEALERVVRECPELSRAIRAITVGVGSRGFGLQALQANQEGQEEEAKTEREDLEAFFKYLCPNRSFSQVMKITVGCRKRFGFAAWEILRNTLGGYPVGANPIEDCKTIRWCLQDEDYTQVERSIRVGNRQETILEMRRFRRFVQRARTGKLKISRKKVYFKEFGDPRHLNRDTGEYWNGSDAPPANWPQATELLIFPVVDAGGEHPEPEWISILPDALASRAIRVINLDVFNNSATPPMAVIIEGTADETLFKKIMDQVKGIKGQTSRSKVLIIQVDNTTAGAGTAKEVVTPKVRIEPLSNLMSTEGMFLKYLMWLEKSISSALRLPLLLVGNIDNTLNRATAEAALVFAEDQVFAPERQDIEDIINDVLLPEVVLFSRRRSGQKGVRYWKFKLGSYNADKTEIFLKLLTYEKGAMSINEKRTLIDSLLPDQSLPAYDDTNANLPWALSPLSTKLPGVSQLPEESGITQAFKQDLSKKLGQPISRVYVYEPEYDDADPCAA
ncbi:MAG: hypothetical protein ACO1RX_20105 [Candidatus Sericytochromatia bacterium]